MLPKPLSSYHYAFILTPLTNTTTGSIVGPRLAADFNRFPLAEFDECGEVDINGDILPVYSFDKDSTRLIIPIDKKQSIILKLKLSGAYSDCLQVKQTVYYRGDTYLLTMMLDCINFMQFIDNGGQIVNNEIIAAFRFNCGTKTELKFVSL